jgi:predicted MFS family arabinose efflux permease
VSAAEALIAPATPSWRPWLFDFIPAGCVDFSFYASLFAIQQVLYARGASAPELASTVAVYSGTYVLCCPLIGSMTSRRPRPAIVLGLFLALCSKLGYSRAQELWHFQALLALFALAAALFWTGFQALIGQETEAEEMPRRLSIFNLGWTTGKASGFVLAGVLSEGGPQTARLAFQIAVALVCLTIFLFIARYRRFESIRSAPVDDSKPAVASAARPSMAFFIVAILINALCWGSSTALVALVPELGKRLQMGAQSQGLLLAAMVVSQAGVFALTRRWRAWTFSRLYSIVPGLILVLALALLGPAKSWPALAFASAALAGVAVAGSYANSIFYALAKDAAGWRPGIHEAALGMGSFTIPMAFGAALQGRSLHEAAVILGLGSLLWTLLCAGLIRSLVRRAEQS